MRKMLILALVFIGSLGLAQNANRSAFGIFLIGGQYTFDLGAAELRLGLGLPLILGGVGLVQGSLDVLFPMGQLGPNARWFLGGGSEIYVGFGGGGSGTVLTPRGFANFEFGADGVSFFIEGGLQGVLAIGGGSVFGASVLIPHGRLGVNFR